MLSANAVTLPKTRRHTQKVARSHPSVPSEAPPPISKRAVLDSAAGISKRALELTLRPIGIVRSPFVDRVTTPRQPAAARGVRGTIELLPGHNFEHALADLEAWDHIWVLFWFHLNTGWRPKVLPPRSAQKRGVFATRSPYRPNPLGLSVLELEAVEGLTLRVRDVDLVDGTPIFDIKPYVPFTDVVPSANTGWLETPDPGPKFAVVWSAFATEQAKWLSDNFRIDLAPPVNLILGLGHEPHPYRRIRAREKGFRLAMKDWRFDFIVEGTEIRITSIDTGYRPSQLATSTDPAILPHRAFAGRFGQESARRKGSL